QFASSSGGRPHQPPHEALLATSEKAHRVGLLCVMRSARSPVGKAARPFGVNADVVQRPEAVLKLLDAVPVAPLCFRMPEQARKKIATVAEFFHRDAQLVTAAHVKFLQPLRFLENLASAVLQSLRRNGRDPTLPEIGSTPLPGARPFAVDQ